MTVDSLTLLNQARRSGRSCDARSHVLSEYVERRLADASDVVQAVSRPVPALTCVAGSCLAECEAQGKPKALVPPGGTGEGKAGVG